MRQKIHRKWQETTLLPLFDRLIGCRSGLDRRCKTFGLGRNRFEMHIDHEILECCKKESVLWAIKILHLNLNILSESVQTRPRIDEPEQRESRECEGPGA